MEKPLRFFFIKFLIGIMSFLFLSHVQGLAQKTAVSNMSQNVMYLHKENELHIIQESVSCHSLKVSTDNGKIQNLGQCKYLYIPERKGLGQIIIRSQKGEYNYLVRVEEGKFAAEVFVGYFSPGLIRKNDFINQLGILIKENGAVPKKPYTVLSYSVMILRENKVVKSFFIRGPKFTPDSREEFSKMIVHDHVLIYNIVVEDSNGQSMYMQPAEFIIQ